MVSLVLVENEFVAAEGISSRLRAAGFDIVGTPATGKDAIAQARKLRPDVVLIDPALKGKMDGIEAAQQIKERFDIPVIFLTAEADAATARRATEIASSGFLVKPFDDLELSAAIEMAIYAHKMEIKARESDRRIRELTESLSEMIFETDMVGNITFVNHAGLKEFGYTKEQVEGGMTLYDFVPPDKHEEIRKSIAQAVVDEPSPWTETLGLRRDGSTFPVSVRASVIVRDGVPVGIHGIALDVTEQKRAEAALMRSERRIRELTDALPEVIFETDANGIITFTSAAMYTRYGWARGEIEGKVNLLDLVAPFDRERARETLAKKIEGADRGWAEYVLFKNDGSTAPFDVRTMPIVRDGVYEGLRGIAIDITERKRAEAALIRNERRIRELTDALPVVVYETDATGRITFVNATAFEMFGYTKEEVEAGISIFQLIAPADSKRARAVFRRRMRGEDVGRVRYAGLRKDGSTFPMSIRAGPMRQDGAVVGLRGVILDFTEQKRAEEWIKESERHIREVTDALPVVVYETDATGRITFVNATALDMFGYTKEELEAGMSIFHVATDADKERARAVFRRRTSFDGVGRMEYTGLRKDGSTFPVAAYGAPIRRDGAVVGVRGIVVDITEQKRAEEMVKEHTDTIEILNHIMTEGNRAASVESFAETVTKLTLELIHFDVGTIHLGDDDTGCAHLRYATGIPDAVIEAIREIPLDEAPYAGFLVEPKPLFVDGHEVPRVPHAAELGLESLATVPLYRYDALIGALNVGSFQRHTFSQAEKELLTAIGNEVGVVIAKLQADALIRAALKERETLLKEIHHRVKNNMQVVSSLLSLQADRATNVEAQAVLTASQSQIRSMALIHEKLYSSGTLSEIDFADYVESLIDELLRMYNVAPGAITITTDIEDVHFGVDTAMPCALILNELVSNCLKHAFPTGGIGEVTIGLQHADGSFTMTVADDGVGYPADADFRMTRSLGMQLVTALVGQLNGTIEMSRGNGTSFVISFSAPP